MLSNQPEAQFVRKPRNEINPLGIAPKELGILKINPVLVIVGVILGLIIFKTHEQTISIS